VTGATERSGRRGRNVLIVNLTRLGDLLQTSPTIAGMHEDDPGVRITLLVDKNFADVCEGIPGVDRILRTDLDQLGRRVLTGGRDLIEAYRGAADLVRELRELDFDLALNFSSSRMSAVFMGLLRIPETRGWCATPEGHRLIAHRWSRLFATLCLDRAMSDINLVDHYRGVGECGSGRQRLRFETSADAEGRAAALLGGVVTGGPLVALQLGASRESRMWPRESFSEVGRDLRASGCRIVLVGGRRERELGQAVAESIGGDVRDLCGRTDIGTLAAVLGHADLLVTGDTGPMHLAAAVGTPIVGLFFGPALPYDTGPYGEDHLLLHAAVPCSPCAHSVTCLDAYCRLEIPPRLVGAAARARLAGDWAQIDELAARPGVLRFLRTGFDSHGLFRCTRLGGGPAPEDEILRRAYRATWLASLEQWSLPEERLPGRIDVAPFERVSRLAQAGLEAAVRLESAATRGAPCAEIERCGGVMRENEIELERLASVAPCVRPLTRMFRFEQESLEAGSVSALADAHRHLYHRLRFESDAMTWLLCGQRATECHHASSDQR